MRRAGLVKRNELRMKFAYRYVALSELYIEGRRERKSGVRSGGNFQTSWSGRDEFKRNIRANIFRLAFYLAAKHP
jgi:hypothetical protein